MTDTPKGRATENSERSENAPELVLRDGNLRSATWRSDGEYGPLFNTRITKLYRDDDGNPRETSTLGSKDLLRASELTRETHQEILKRQRENVQERKVGRDDQQPALSQDWHDDTKRRDEIKRERFKEDRAKQGTRRTRPRDRTAR